MSATAERDVMHTLASGFDEAAHRSVGLEWLEQLNVRPANRDHCLLDTLLGNHLSRDRLGAKEAGIVGKRRIEISHGDGNMVEVVSEHSHKVLDGGGEPHEVSHPRPGRSGLLALRCLEYHGRDPHGCTHL